MDIQADMKIIEKNGIMAAGTVTIDGLFIIQEVIVRLIKQNDGTEKPVIFLPRRKTGETGWKDVFEVSSEMKKEIDYAVGKSIKDAACRDNYAPNLDVSVTIFVKKDLLGYATLTYENAITIKDIQIYKADNEYGIRLLYPSYKGDKDDKWHSLIDIGGYLFDDVICRKVSEAYEEKLKNYPDFAERHFSKTRQQRGKSL
ncbi:MAG: SpoVG family protein [Lachnospiraceae bacterium]|nr:SpoVG family protein [Lachnospiraceae bacterium]